jgi:hypothetical protein
VGDMCRSTAVLTGPKASHTARKRGQYSSQTHVRDSDEVLPRDLVAFALCSECGDQEALNRARYNTFLGA